MNNDERDLQNQVIDFLINEKGYPPESIKLSPQALDDSDPGYCGLDPLTTGPNDPWWKIACQPHDAAFDKLIATGQGSDAGTFLTFTGNIIDGMAKGLYMLISGPIYWTVGGIGGLFRWSMVVPKDKIKPDSVDSEEGAT